MDISFSLSDISNSQFATINIKDAVMMWSNLVNTHLSKIDFENVNLKGANFSNAMFLDVSFENVNLIGANFTDAIIINILSYNELKVNSKTNFLNAIIDDPQLIKFLEQANCMNVPEKIYEKSALYKKL
jgi:uncharacterized protein YjbI with pentapeptide repeats